MPQLPGRNPSSSRHHRRRPTACHRRRGDPAFLSSGDDVISSSSPRMLAYRASTSVFLASTFVQQAPAQARQAPGIGAISSFRPADNRRHRDLMLNTIHRLHWKHPRPPTNIVSFTAYRTVHSAAASDRPAAVLTQRTSRQRLILVNSTIVATIIFWHLVDPAPAPPSPDPQICTELRRSRRHCSLLGVCRARAVFAVIHPRRRARRPRIGDNTMSHTGWAR